MDDELFRPTIDAAPAAASSPPWRPESIVYPALFGGPLAATVLGVINGRRLGLRLVPLLAIAATGVVAVVGRVLATRLLDEDWGPGILGSAAGVVVWGVVRSFEKRPFRAFLYRDREPASLVGPGWAAAIGGGLVEALIVFVAVS